MHNCVDLSFFVFYLVTLASEALTMNNDLQIILNVNLGHSILTITPTTIMGAYVVKTKNT